MLRKIFAVLLFALALPVGAQQPPKLEPLPELPPPPPGASDQPEEPPVRIRSGQDQVEEQLVDGRHVVRVTTPSGQEYWLVEDLNDGTGIRNESLDHGVRAPLWVIKRF
ncbi:MAG TPA: DUF2782 domain-containing protein [Burkholderiales bacterium]|jgi:hypothetical protein|nr:DUF2782 domain-containing protein [Burkholderiales bacterium]